MSVKKPLRLILLALAVMAIGELFVVTRWLTDTFDPRCLLVHGYIVAHTYPNGQEVIRCVPDAP